MTGTGHFPQEVQSGHAILILPYMLGGVVSGRYLITWDVGGVFFTSKSQDEKDHSKVASSTASHILV
jgi:hypothetical protein